MKILASIIIIGFLVHLFFYWISRNTAISRNTTNRKLDCYLPVYHFVERHEIVIYSSPEKILKAAHNFDMGKSKVINTLIFLRNIHKHLHFNKKPEPTIISINQLTETGGWLLLEKVDKQESVIGLVGKFWRSGDTVYLSNAADFINFTQTGYAKVAMNFFTEKNDDVSATLSTETRILCLGGRAKLLFGLYWAIIRPYSGWIRLEMLKMIKEQAENH